MTLPTYSQRHLDPALATAYASKFERNLLRRLSNRRETKIVVRAIEIALGWLAKNGVPRDQATLLDCPCGAGRFSAHAAMRVAHYIAGDHSPHMVELTIAALRQNGLGERIVSTVTGDARNLPMAQKAANITLSMRLLHHFADRSDRSRILQELRRVTDGPLVTSFLDAESWKQRRHVARITRLGQNSRRVLLSMADFAAEAGAVGWQVADSWPLSSVFSGQRVVLCLPSSGELKPQGGAFG